MPPSYIAYPSATLTPLTSSESSPPDKMPSPRSGKRTFDQMQGTATRSPYGHAPPLPQQNGAIAIATVLTPPEHPKQARPGPGEPKGYRLVYDPETDQSLKSSDKKKYKHRYKQFGAESVEPPAPPDPRLAIAGYATGIYNRKQNKARLRPAPYVAKPYAFDPKISVGRGPAKRIVVCGFDPLTHESKIKNLLGQFGEVSELKNETDPNTGSFVGVCSVTFRDSVSRSGVVSKASDAAQKAEKDGTGQRIDHSTIKIERDPEGIRCRRYVASAIKSRQAELERLHQQELHVRPKPPPPPPLATDGPPPDAPKGPSGKPPPQGPRMTFAPRPSNPAHSLLEKEPVLNKIKRQPYIFIAPCYVPVLGTTVPHLQKRLRMFKWSEIRCDMTGYYIIFEDSKFGELECVKCYNESHMQPLFTYCMNMDLQKYGNPFYERSPTPERAQAEQKEREERIQIRKEDEEDFEVEKRERAENLDPTRAALELLIPNLTDVIMNDIKRKIGTAAIFDYLAPEKHTEKRRKLGIADPTGADTQRPFQISRPFDTPYSSTPEHQMRFGGGYRRGFDRFGRRIRRDEPSKPVNAFTDERRRALPPPRRPIQTLHRRLQDNMESDDESDDERRTSVTRASDGQDSRAISEVAPSPMQFDADEDGHLTPKPKRRRTEAGWGAESDDESIEVFARKTLGHLLDKEPEDMANRELEQILSTLPRSSRLHKRALAEVKLRQKAEEDDELFFGPSKQKEKAAKLATTGIGITVEDTDSLAGTPEPAEQLAKMAKKRKAPAKPRKRATKKQQALEELQATAAATPSKLDSVEPPESEPPATIDEEETPPVEEERAEVEWGVSTTHPRRTVEDDFTILLDLDGWQNLVKDDEDLMFLREALRNESGAGLGEAELWAWNQKQIKLLNNGGIPGTTRQTLRIDGYYVPNATGCARTEGVKKIFESDKSKYLPHRLRVQRAREEREALAKKDPSVQAETAKAAAAAAKAAPLVSSRQNRAANRRLVNDINTSKQNLGIESDAMRFNQLKKRKKLVKFDRSAIHNWGLYAMENIAQNDMIIEYVGEKVRQRVADLREQTYQKQGIGSSYLFRIDEDTVIDATKKGGIARFINHSCMPNCTAKIIKVDGTKRIVIYALRDIAKNEELTYDYKFEREINSDDRIPCLCGSIGCKGFLN